MAKGIYIGVESPVYGPSETQTITVDVTASNISDYFTVANGTYYFVGNGSVFTTNNAGVNSSTATTTLTLLRDMTVGFTYSYSSESNYDKFTLSVGSTTVENAVSGATTSKTYSPTLLTAGTQIAFTYAKDSSQSKNDDQCTFSAMQISYDETIPGEITGYKGIAKKVKKMYIGVHQNRVEEVYEGEGPSTNIQGYYGEVNNLGEPIWEDTLNQYRITSETLIKYSDAEGYVSTNYEGVAFIPEDDFRTAYIIVFDTAAGAGTTSNKYVTTSLAGNFARKVKKGYIGVGGVARPFFSGFPIEYYGAIGNLYTAGRAASTKVGNYALIGCGYFTSTSYCSNINAVNQSLTVISATSAQQGYDYPTGASVGNYGIIAAGVAYSSTYGSYSSDGYAYDTSLTQTKIDLDVTGSAGKTGGSIGNYALFVGGWSRNVSSGNYSMRVSARSVDTSLTVATATSMTGNGNGEMASANAGNYILFAGGYIDSDTGDKSSMASAVKYYDLSLTRSVTSDLTYSIAEHGGATVNGYALFAVGNNIIDVYSSSLTKSILSTSQLVNAKGSRGTSLGNFALLQGRTNSGSVVEVYDESLTKTIPDSQPTGTWYQAAFTNVGKYAILGTGYIVSDRGTGSTTNKAVAFVNNDM